MLLPSHRPNVTEHDGYVTVVGYVSFCCVATCPLLAYGDSFMCFLVDA